MGPTPELLFAPSEISRRIDHWGAEEYLRRCADALAQFVDGSHRGSPVSAPAGRWRPHRRGRTCSAVASHRPPAGSSCCMIDPRASIPKQTPMWQDDGPRLADRDPSRTIFVTV